MKSDTYEKELHLNFPKIYTCLGFQEGPWKVCALESRYRLPPPHCASLDNRIQWENAAETVLELLISGLEGGSLWGCRDYHLDLTPLQGIPP